MNKHTRSWGATAVGLTFGIVAAGCAPVHDDDAAEASLAGAPALPAACGTQSCSEFAQCLEQQCVCAPGYAGDGNACMRTALQAQTAFLKAANPGINDYFGETVVLSRDGSTLAVVATGEDTSVGGIDPPFDDAGFQTGAVYVYARTESPPGWSLVMVAKAVHPAQQNHFGNNHGGVALSGNGDVLVIGNMSEDSSGAGVATGPESGTIEESGAVQVYERIAGAYHMVAFIKAEQVVSGDQFGSAVAVSDDGRTIAVGALGGETVSIYERKKRWKFSALLTHAPMGMYDHFGHTLALSGDGKTLAVGAPSEGGSGSGIDPAVDDEAPGTGAVFVYVRGRGPWIRQAYVKALHPPDSRERHFGFALALSYDGNDLFVSAPWEGSTSMGVDSVPNDEKVSIGAVYTYRRVAGVWHAGSYLKPLSPEWPQYFGWSLAVSADGSRLAVGTNQEPTACAGFACQPGTGAIQNGAVYVLERAGGVWSHRQFLKGPDAREGEFFGTGVAINGAGDVVVVGAPGEDTACAGVACVPDELLSGSGAAYVYE